MGLERSMEQKEIHVYKRTYIKINIIFKSRVRKFYLTNGAGIN